MPEKSWADWVIEKLESGSPVIRMSATKVLLDTKFEAMIIVRFDAEAGPVLGIINYNSHPAEMNTRTGRGFPQELNLVASEHPDAWKRFLILALMHPQEWFIETDNAFLVYN